MNHSDDSGDEERKNISDEHEGDVIESKERKKIILKIMNFIKKQSQKQRFIFK